MLIDLIKRKFRTFIFRLKNKSSLYLAFIRYLFSVNTKYESYKNRLKILVNKLDYKDLKKVFIFVCFTNKLTLSHKEYMNCMSKAGYKIIYVNNSETNLNDLKFLKLVNRIF